MCLYSRMYDTQESSDSQQSGDDRCSCGERSVRDCRTGCWGTDDCGCGGRCNGSDGWVNIKFRYE